MSGDKWIKVYEPGKAKINRNILFEIDPTRHLVRVVRRKVESIINLRAFYADLQPLPESEKRQA